MSFASNILAPCDDCSETNLNDWFLGYGLEISSTTRKYRLLIEGQPRTLPQWVHKCLGM